MATLNYDGLRNEAYDPRLYEVDATLDPINGLAAFGPAQEEQYRALGFVTVAGAFSPGATRAAIEGLAHLVARSDLPSGIELQFESEARGLVEELSPEDRLDYVRKLMWFTQHEPRLSAIAKDPSLLAVVECLLGAEPELFQDMALFKPPGIGREKPWHQDHAYFNVPQGTPVVGVWIALDEADLQNGCMVLQPGGHHGGPLPHFNRRDWQICDADVLKRGHGVAAPLPSGGCLIFDGLVPHGTPTNRSNRRRRAVQFHYIPVGTPRITLQERMEIFGEGAFGASC